MARVRLSDGRRAGSVQWGRKWSRKVLQQLGLAMSDGVSVVFLWNVKRHTAHRMTGGTFGLLALAELVCGRVG